jgi:hypothetical protein
MLARVGLSLAIRTMVTSLRWLWIAALVHVGHADASSAKADASSVPFPRIAEFSAEFVEREFAHLDTKTLAQTAVSACHPPTHFRAGCKGHLPLQRSDQHLQPPTSCNNLQLAQPDALADIQPFIFICTVRCARRSMYRALHLLHPRVWPALGLASQRRPQEVTHGNTSRAHTSL